jgi:hypothetical protein
MDQTMKQLMFFALMLSSTGFAQTWQTIPNEHFNVDVYTSGTNTVSTNYSHFEINPYDGTMWFISNNSLSNFNIKRINVDGSMTLFTPSNMPFMDVSSCYFQGIDFSSSKTYALHRFDGAFSYDGTNWTYEELFNKGTTVCADGDTVYFGRENEDFIRLTEVGATYNNWLGSRRLSARNGVVWSSSAFESEIHLLNATYDNATFYNPNSSNFLLDYSNNDFKFARTSDTLYVAGDQGFSLAHGDVFVDTITMNNAPNMPYPSIIEFEFDSHDNIWAVFGVGGVLGFYPMYIGYYDQSVQDWTLIYDQTNSPINFTQRLDLEIDSDDNVWVCDRYDLHVLKINATPGWLSLAEEGQEQFSVFPNPSSGHVSIQTDANVSDIEILDVTGRVIQSMSFSSQIFIEEKGMVFIRLLDDGVLIGTQKLVIEQ